MGLRPFWRRDDACDLLPDWAKKEYPATITISPGTDLRDALQNRNPGDVVECEAGIYEFSNPGAHAYLEFPGTEAEPIVIRSASGAQVHFKCQLPYDGLEIKLGTYTMIQGIEITGGKKCVRLENCDNFVLYRNHIHHSESSGLIGANLPGLQSIFIVENDLHHPAGHGEGIYVGSWTGEFFTKNVTIAGNHIHDLVSRPGYNVSQGDGIDLKTGCANFRVLYNWIENCREFGIKCHDARWAEDSHLIDSNVIVNCGQVSYGACVGRNQLWRNNVIIGGRKGAMTARTDDGTSTGVGTVVANNLLSHPSRGINMARWQDVGTDVVVANNAVICQGKHYYSGPGPVSMVSNSELADSSQFADFANYDLEPVENSVLLDAGDSDYISQTDIFGRIRTRSDIGPVERIGVVDPDPKDVLIEKLKAENAVLESRVNEAISGLNSLREDLEREL